MKPESFSARLRQRAAIGVSVGAAVLGGGEVLAHSPKAAAGATEHSATPIYGHNNQELAEVAKEAEILVAHDLPHTYKDSVIFQGHKLTRYVIAAKEVSGSTYSQLIVYMAKGDKVPDTVAVTYGAPRARFQVQNVYNEPFNRVITWVPNPKQPAEYLVADTYQLSGGNWMNKYYQKNGLQNTYWENAGPKRTISDQAIQTEFESLITRQKDVIHQALNQAQRG